MNYLEQCQTYDPQAIARYYNQRPWLIAWRIISVIYTFLGFFLGLGSDRLTNREYENQPQRAKQLRQIITKLGPTYIKVGQALSTRPDLVRADYLAELVKLQDQLPAFATSQAFKILEQELATPLDQVYSYICPTPVAAASLGQVYKANLLTGEEVAIKVQRPNLIPTITLDLCVIRKLVIWLAAFLPLTLGQNLDAVVDEFGTKLFEEIDYINEATNAERFAAYFAGDRQVKVPVIYRRFSTRHILTMEWINGIKLTDTAAIKAAGLDTDELVKIGVLAGMRQLLEFGFFHADPHPGNLFATYDGRMAYIDFGMMDQLNLTTKEQLVDSVVHLINKDYQQLGQDYINLGFLAPDVEMMPIVNALEAVLGDIMSEKVSDFNFKVVTDRFSDLMYTYPFCLPAKFALIIRSVITQEGVALSMNPEFKIVQVAYPYVARRLLTDESASLRRRLLEVLFKDNRFQWERLENLIGIAKSDQNFDLVPTATMGLQYLFSEEGKLLRQRLIMAITEDDRLHISEVQRLWQLVAADLQPVKLINAALSRFNFSQSLAAMIPITLGLNNFNT